MQRHNQQKSRVGELLRLARRRPYLLLGALLLIGGLIWALRPGAAEVDIATLARGDMLVTVDEEGKTHIKNLYVVSSPLAGKLRRLPIDPGDSVVKNETVLAVIEPTSPLFLDARSRKVAEAQVEAARAAVALAEAEHRQAETELEWAASELKRMQRLIQSSTVSERVFERAKLDHQKQTANMSRAKANLELRRSELMSARANLIGPTSILPTSNLVDGCCVEVRSPETGKVLRELQESERVVVAGTPLVEIGDPASLEIVVELLSSDAVRIVPGAEATIEGTGLPVPIRGKVRLIEPAGFTKVSALGIEEQRVRVFLELATPSAVWARLGHDYRVFARIAAWHGKDALRVPLSALYRRGDKWAVYKRVGGRAVEQLVEIGHRNNEHAEVLGGLAAGDEVVLHPSDRVKDGGRIVQRRVN
ncbi:MAG: HlyD family efflux transporter periplasmic adaptor subunit [Hyphomicrobiaceae bacterium]|nr:MAG: HlyD family efflux transporter periplasmic adaptor subunit [Hyphomicrobiaceae bacterium]